MGLLAPLAVVQAGPGNFPQQPAALCWPSLGKQEGAGGTGRGGCHFCEGCEIL